MAQPPQRSTIIATGLNGLVGSKLAQEFSAQYDFHSLDISDPTQPVDITDEKAVMAAVEHSSGQAIVHLAAFTDVSAAWAQRGDKNGLTYRVNVQGTANVVKAAERFGKHLIHISTAYVFDGSNLDLYTENETPGPIEWYGETKAMAEELVQASSAPWTILRIDQPFRSDTYPRPDILRRTLNFLSQEKPFPFFTDHFFGPTFIDDFVKVIEWAIRTHTVGLFHASSGEKWSDYDFAQRVNEIFKLKVAVKPGSLSEYLKTISRPYQRNTALDISKLRKVLDFKQVSVLDALQQAEANE